MGLSFKMVETSRKTKKKNKNGVDTPGSKNEQANPFCVDKNRGTHQLAKDTLDE